MHVQDLSKPCVADNQSKKTYVDMFLHVSASLELRLDWRSKLKDLLSFKTFAADELRGDWRPIYS